MLPMCESEACDPPTPAEYLITPSDGDTFGCCLRCLPDMLPEGEPAVFNRVRTKIPDAPLGALEQAEWLSASVDEWMSGEVDGIAWSELYRDQQHLIESYRAVVDSLVDWAESVVAFAEQHDMLEENVVNMLEVV